MIRGCLFLQNYPAYNGNRFKVREEATQIITEPTTQGVTFDPYELPVIPKR